MSPAPSIAPAAPSCGYQHHDQAKGVEHCPKHLEPTVCGPFAHRVCLRCEPFHAAPCGLCGKRRVDCTC